MIFVLAGPLHGRIQQLYSSIKELEKGLPEPISWVLQLGDLGVYPDPSKMSKNSKRRGAEAQFASLYLQEEGVPIPTLFIPGLHDDLSFLNYRASCGSLEIIPNLHYLMPGFSGVIGDQVDKLSVVGLGKSYSPNIYSGKTKKGSKVTKHYTRRDVERACSQGLIDLFLSYEAPAGEHIGPNLVSSAEGVQKICFATRPKLLAHRGASGAEFLQYQTASTATLALRIPPLAFYALQYKDNELVPLK